MAKMSLNAALLLLTLASTTLAQFGGYGGYSNPGNNNGGNGNNGQNGGFGGVNSYISSREKYIIAHGVLASLAFVIFFPVGGILIRLSSFPGVWLLHGLFQLFAYTVFIAAFGIGLWIVLSLPSGIPYNLLTNAHPVIGMILFALLFFQPILGFLHHTLFKKHGTRTFWSYAHIWLGRIVITLGIINGGLGLRLAEQTGIYRPTHGQIVAYAVVGGLMWVLYIAAAVFGEVRRKRRHRAEKARYAYDTRENGPAYSY